MNRRSFVYLAGGTAIGVGGYHFSQSDSDVGEVFEGLSEVAAEATKPTGTRRFNFNGSGYDYAEWTDDGTLRIQFQDEPPMQEWMLVGPRPEREVLASGQPPQFGGSRTHSFDLPITEGEYLLTGAKLVSSADSLVGVDAERTGTVDMQFESRVLVEDVTQVEDSPKRAELTLRNVGSIPINAAGAKFEGVPGSGTSDYEFFEDGEVLLLPTDEVTVTTSSIPFAVPNSDETNVPAEYNVSIWAHDEPHDFSVTEDDVEPVEQSEPN